MLKFIWTYCTACNYKQCKKAWNDTLHVYKVLENKYNVWFFCYIGLPSTCDYTSVKFNINKTYLYKPTEVENDGVLVIRVQRLTLNTKNKNYLHIIHNYEYKIKEECLGFMVFAYFFQSECSFLFLAKVAILKMCNLALLWRIPLKYISLNNRQILCLISRNLLCTSSLTHWFFRIFKV